MATITLKTTSNDGDLYADSQSSYASARGASTGDVNDTSVTFTVSNYYTTPIGGMGGWQIYRAALFFDTSVIPDDATISSAKLVMYHGSQIDAATINIVSGSDITDELVEEDYGELLNDTTSYGSSTIAGTESAGDAFEITLNATGRSAIDKEGVTVLALRDSDDINNNDPNSAASDNNINNFYSSLSSGLETGGDALNNVEPRLIITYTGGETTVSKPKYSTNKRGGYTIKVWKYRWSGGFDTGVDNPNKPIRDLVGIWDDATFDGFEKNINGGLGECILRLGRPFDDYGEGDDVDLYNMVEIWNEKTSEKIYTGYISKYAPYIEGSQEGVDVTLLGYQTSLKFQTFHFNHTSNEVYQEHLKHTLYNINPSNLVTHIVDGYAYETDRVLEPVDAFSPINWTTKSVETSENAASKLTFHMPTKWEVLDWCVNSSTNIDYWYMDSYATINYKEYNDEEDHSFIFGKHFKSVYTENSMEDVFNKSTGINRRQLNDNGFVGLHYPLEQNTSFGSEYLEEGYLREELIQDIGLESQKEIYYATKKRYDVLSEPQRSIRFDIADDVYDIDTIDPGDTCRLQGLGIKGIDLNNLVIRKVTYLKDYVKIEVQTKEEQLRSNITNDTPTKNIKVLGREDIPKSIYKGNL